MPVTIGRNRRQYVINIKNDYTQCLRYSGDTGEATAADSAEAWNMLESHRDARLIESDDRSVYTIRLGKDYFELRRP